MKKLEVNSHALTQACTLVVHAKCAAYQSIIQCLLPGKTELAKLLKEPSLLAGPTLPPPIPAKWWLLKFERSLLPSKFISPDCMSLLVKLPARLGP